jgi:hypothetical protein
VASCPDAPSFSPLIDDARCAMRRRRGRRTALILLVAASGLGIPAFVVASLSLNSIPVPREFPGWAAVFAGTTHLPPRVFVTMTPSTPGGYGRHPNVEYAVTVCDRKMFDGLLVLAGDARIRLSSADLQPTSPGRSEAPWSYVPNVQHLRITDVSTGAAADTAPVQVFRIRIPSTPCHTAYNPSTPTWEGHTVIIRGALEGQTAHQSFAPFGLWPVRHAHSWPYLGQVPVFHPINRGAFTMGAQLPGLWVRPLQSYFGVDLDLLDGKSSVDFSRPDATEGLESLAWAGIKPLAAKARVTNIDNLNNWQTISLGTSIWLGVGGSVLASVALDSIRRGRQRPPVPQPESSIGHEPIYVPHERGSTIAVTRFSG